MKVFLFVRCINLKETTATIKCQKAPAKNPKALANIIKAMMEPNETKVFEWGTIEGVDILEAMMNHARVGEKFWLPL